MVKKEWTLDEVLAELEAAETCFAQPNMQTVEMIMYVERLFYNKHISDIQARQDKLKYLEQDEDRFVAFWFGREKDREDLEYMKFWSVISPGCRACLTDLITHIRHSYKCSQNCDFCYYKHATIPVIGKGLYAMSESESEMTFTLEEAKLLIHRQLPSAFITPSAIGWLQKEPLEELESLSKLMPEIAKKGIHQYLYTNGVLATNEAIDILADCGLNEIRFNLQATDFSPKIIRRMGYAKKRIPWVLIETPIFSESYNNFVESKDYILDTGLDQINIPELQIVSPEAMSLFEDEGPIYKHRRGYISPISSRHYAYDLIELAEAEKWPVIINDCSNDTKFFRGVSSRHPLGVVNYKSNFELPFRAVAYLAKQAMDDGVTYEFF